MKSTSTLFLVLLAFFSIATVKANNLPIPVAANESITVTMFFPTEIKQVIQPAVNYKFEYEPNATMATLIARKGATSNLTVITKCGSIFSFLLKYNTEVDNFTYVLSAENAIGRLEKSGTVAVTTILTNTDEIEKEKAEMSKGAPKPVAKPKMKALKSEPSEVKIKAKSLVDDKEDEDVTPIGQGNSLYEKDKNEYYQIFCENNYAQKARLRKTYIAGSDVTLQLNTVAADKNELYFVLEVNNTLDTEFKTQNLNFYVRTGKNDTPLTITPLYAFNSPVTISPESKVNMVYVFKEFKLANNQKMYIVMDEEGGRSKKVMLKVGSKTINNATN